MAYEYALPVDNRAQHMRNLDECQMEMIDHPVYRDQ